MRGVAGPVDRSLALWGTRADRDKEQEWGHGSRAPGTEASGGCEPRIGAIVWLMAAREGVIRNSGLAIHG